MQMGSPSEAVSKCFLFTVFIFNGTLPFRMLTNNTYTYTILFMNLMMICKLHQWNKTYFNRQSNDLQSLVELCVAQPSRSQVTGRKEPLERGCVLMSSSLLQPFWEKWSEKVHATSPKRYCGWFWVHSSSKKFERIAWGAMDVCLRVLKESNKSRLDSYSVREKCIDHIPYYLSGLSRPYFFGQPFSK